MKVWLVDWMERGYDNWDAIIVNAETEAEAKKVLPEPYGWMGWESTPKGQEGFIPPDAELKVRLLGEAPEGAKAGLVEKFYWPG